MVGDPPTYQVPVSAATDTDKVVRKADGIYFAKAKIQENNFKYMFNIH